MEDGGCSKCGTSSVRYHKTSVSKNEHIVVFVIFVIAMAVMIMF